MLRRYDEDFFGDFLVELDRVGYATVKLRVDEDGPELAEYEFCFRGIDTMIEVAKTEGMNQTRRKIDGVCRSIDTTRQNRLNDNYSDDGCDWFDEWCRQSGNNAFCCSHRLPDQLNRLIRPLRRHGANPSPLCDNRSWGINPTHVGVAFTTSASSFVELEALRMLPLPFWY